MQARSLSAADRLKKFVRRKRVQVQAAGLVFPALVAGAVGATLGLVVRCSAVLPRRRPHE